VFDLERLRACQPFAGHDRGAWHLALTPDDRTLFSTGSDEMVRVWDVADRTQLAAFEAETGLSRIVVAGPGLIVVGTATGAVVPFRLERGGAQPSGSRASAVTDLTRSPG
jgi:WD40 repeat protein